MVIAVANSSIHNTGISLGYGNSSFFTQTNCSTSAYSPPYFLATADFNHDNHLNIVLTDYNRSNVGIFLGYGNGSFQNHKTYRTDSYPYSDGIGNFDNDGTFDIIVANYGTNIVVSGGATGGGLAEGPPPALQNLKSNLLPFWRNFC